MTEIYNYHTDRTNTMKKDRKENSAREIFWQELSSTLCRLTERISLYIYIKHQQSKFNLKSRKCPPPTDELKPFEHDMFDLIEQLKFKSVRNPFQERLKQDIKKINATDKVFIFADKTRNIYGLDKEQHKKLLRETSQRVTRNLISNLSTW